MSMFKTLLSKIFGHPAAATSTASAAPSPASANGARPAAPTATVVSNAAAAPAAAAPTAAPTQAPAAGAATTGSATPQQQTPQQQTPQQQTPQQPVDISAVLDAMAAQNPEKLNWKTSIVDLMKLVGMDSSLSARKELATELGYTGNKEDSATMNIWLHKQVLRKLAENGGKVPAELLD